VTLNAMLVHKVVRYTKIDIRCNILICSIPSVPNIVTFTVVSTSVCFETCYLSEVSSQMRSAEMTDHSNGNFWGS